MFKNGDIVCIFLRNRVYRLRQKNNPLTCRCNFSSPCLEKNVYHSPASKFFHKKRHSYEFFTKKRQFCEKICDIFCEKILSILCSHRCGNIYTRFHAFIWWRKNRYVKIFSRVLPLI